MREWKRILGGTVLALLCVLMTGCGKVTAKSLLFDAAKTIGKSESVDMDILFRLDADGGLASMIGVGLELDAKVQQKKGCVLEGEVTAKILDREVALPIRSYLVFGEGCQAYLYDPMRDQWSVTEYQAGKASDFLTGSLREYLQLLDQMELSKETQEYQEKECYLVSGTIRGADLGEIIDQIAEAAQVDYLSGDLIKDLEAKADFYFDKKEKELAGAVFHFYSAGGEQTESASSLEIRINSYGGYQFELPEEIKESAERKEASGAAEGGFTLAGEMYTLLDKVQVLEEAGWESEMGEPVLADSFEKRTYTKEGMHIELLLLNETDADQPGRECRIAGIWDTSDERIVRLDGDTGVGSTRQEILSVFGKPGGVFVDEEYQEGNASSLDYSFGNIRLSFYMLEEDAEGIYLGIVWQEKEDER